ncbi:(S)-benzoin forming benzil reductase [Oceanobacillus halophilus]|uniref:(S)-benzoin forming benzil reductase n=1 Tax=Oceanobacillus halophilus TaxID=930130 RepID=A0A494ZX74_9BACI|nr:(S)-benzoin forming benzil reductase [Oceanobacillus halophilus]RKQ31244.1 (S)-benzoin forming benzil reductase [Oceanobacillus halophilus]
MKKFAIITGVSRGLGEGIAKLLLESGVNVIGVSRSKNLVVPDIAKENNLVYQHYSCDLGDADQVETIFNEIKNHVFTKETSEVFLINNAATVEPMDQAMNLKTRDILQHVQVNTVAPMILTNLFLKEAHQHEIPGIAVIVTSGAADRPIYGWSTYCATKASMNMYTQSVALEQDELATGNKIIAFNPGVMDTEMQETIRSRSKEEFSDVERYQKLKEENKLNSPIDVAGVLIDIINDEDVVNGKIYNVKNYL